MPDEETMSPAAMLEEFHEALGDARGRGGVDLRYALHEEEHRELLDELDHPSDMYVDRAKLARELADVVYVAYGTAHAFDIDLEAALAEVHRAAMSKIDPPCPVCGGDGDDWSTAGDGALVPADCRACGGTGSGPRMVRDDGKPPGFVPPDMSGAVL